ncbi:MAG TPA: single-stranded-DNA-specific exonuclease RecJ [Dehalococcoidia bacterium]|nr:single-stranded-DNA-specific exonuclease RecJ [Dehalococcoidia bacterium]
MSLLGRQWRTRGRVPEDVFAAEGYSPLLRHLLWHRQLRSPAEISAFLFDTPFPSYDPLLLPQMEAAVQRIRQALRAGETIAVFGDFDVDGVTASVVLTEGLRDLGANVFAYIPHRFTEGYGLSLAAIEALRLRGACLIITADCGTSSIAEIDHARGLGIDVVVLDHHTVPEELPAAIATVNPKRVDCLYPEAELASVGLALKLLCALYEAEGRPLDEQRYLDLVALGTVADMAPLLGENRWLVRQGLQTLRRTQRPGLRALMEVAGVEIERADTETIGFQLGPRLNAAGRLAHAQLSFELLTCTDEAEALLRAAELGALNQERQRLTAEAMTLLRELLAGETEAPLLFVGHTDVSSGIVGLVAGRLAEQYHRPTIVYELGENESRGSARSIIEFDITSAMRRNAELFIRFGGHRQAAGFTATNEALPRIKEALLETAAHELAEVDLTPTLEIDAAFPLRHLRGEEIKSLVRLQPFGQGNPEPLFLSRAVTVAEARPVGEDGAHLRMKLRDGRVTWPAIGFGLGETGELAEGQAMDVVYSLSSDRNSEGGLQLVVRDLAPATGAQS